MRTPTPDQQTAIAHNARVRVVRAAPGSGKTWMVAEAIRNELSSWMSGQGGIAALSFTRVGGEEIRNALGRPMAHPHFVGTIDSFLFRYVVRPHIRAVNPLAKTPELIPTDWQPAEIWTSPKIGTRGVNPFACYWIGRGGNGEPILAHVVKNRGMQALDAGEMKQVIAFKRALLQNHGRLTVSDSARYASYLLQHPEIGEMIRAEVVRRFPLLIVDELQDTGVFLAESIQALLSHTEARGLLVGDPDQAIYEFNGAAPEMFDEFASIAGASVLPLQTTRRCPAAITAVASHLTRSGDAMIPAAGRTGHAFLVRYTDMVPDVTAIATAYRRVSSTDVIKVIARGNSTVEMLTGRSGSEIRPLWCQPTTMLHRAVRHFRCGRTVSALAAARAAVETVLFGGSGLTNDQLDKQGVAPASLKAVAIDCLLAANALPTTGTALEWEVEARDTLMSYATTFCAQISRGAPKAPGTPQKRDGHDALIARTIPSVASMAQALDRVPVLTVHGVKGETHDVTIFVVPPTGTGPKKCPSTLWWPNQGADDEERRIAYVAFTRSCRDLVVCVDERAYERLIATRAEFVADFECFSAQEFLAATAPGILGMAS